MDIYTQEIITKRLKLRKLNYDDYVVMHKWFSSDNVTKFLPWTTHKTIEQTRLYMDCIQNEYNNKKTYRWGIVLSKDNKLIGMIDVWKYQNDGTPELGWILDEDYWNNGYMSEALRNVLIFLKNEGFKCVFATADENNIASNKIIRKQGFIFDRTVKKQQGLNRLNVVHKNEYHLNF